jgi:hypothetical protein
VAAPPPWFCAAVLTSITVPAESEYRLSFSWPDELGGDFLGPGEYNVYAGLTALVTPRIDGVVVEVR